MGASKSESFSVEQNEMATLFKALSHPARIAIVDYLLTNIIKGTIEGTAICYCINPDTIDKIENHFGMIRHKLKNKCC